LLLVVLVVLVAAAQKGVITQGLSCLLKIAKVAIRSDLLKHWDG